MCVTCVHRGRIVRTDRSCADDGLGLLTTAGPRRTGDAVVIMAFVLDK